MAFVDKNPMALDTVTGGAADVQKVCAARFLPHPKRAVSS
jgi:hypothetical protein